MVGFYPSKNSDRESSEIPVRYVLIGSALGSTINVIYLAGWRFGNFYLEFLPTIILMHSFLSISLQNTLVTFFATFISVYIGLWTIGKVKLNSPAKGLMVGLLVTVFSVPVIVILLFVLYCFLEIPNELFSLFSGTTLIAIISENLLGSLPGGLLGGILVEFVAPDYCPKCRARLKTGVLHCPNCGWGG